MKIGAENKKTTAVAIGLMVVALFMVVWMFSSLRTGTTVAPPTIGDDSNKPAASRVRANAANRGDPRSRHVAFKLPETLDPRLRLDLLKDSEENKYQGSGRNIFRQHLEEIPAPVKGGLLSKKPPEVPPGPTGPPPPPPINLKFFGWASRPGEPKAVFLSQGDSVFVAKEGEIVARRYKVVKINNNNVEIQDVLSNNTQSIPLTQG